MENKNEFTQHLTARNGQFFAFLKKMGDMYSILDITFLPKDITDKMKLLNYDLLFPIDNLAVDYYIKSKNTEVKDSKIKYPIQVYVKKDFNQTMITVADLVIIDLNKELFMDNDKKTDNNIDDEDLLNEYLFEQEKDKILRDFIGYQFPKATTFDLTNFLELTMLYIEFAGHGYFITEENKEDIFIKIIEDDNDDLLNKLEKFLELKKHVDEFKSSFQLYYEIKEDLEMTDYWDYDNFDEAMKALEEKHKEYNEKYQNESIRTFEEEKEFLLKLKEKIKEIKEKKKNEA